MFKDIFIPKRIFDYLIIIIIVTNNNNNNNNREEEEEEDLCSQVAPLLLAKQGVHNIVGPPD